MGCSQETVNRFTPLLSGAKKSRGKKWGVARAMGAEKIAILMEESASYKGYGVVRGGQVSWNSLELVWSSYLLEVC